MSDPIPLTKPDGTVYAHVCGVCGTIGGGGVARLTDEGATAVTEDSSRDDAERCCVCRTCRAPSPYAIECADCRAKWRAKMEAEAAERAALATTSVAAEDAEHYTLTVNGHALDVAVEDEFGVYTRATVRHRDADDPTRNDDWSKASRCGVAAILEACIGAAYRFDAEEVTLVPKGAVVIPPAITHGRATRADIEHVLRSPAACAAVVTRDVLVAWMRAQGWTLTYTAKNGVEVWYLSTKTAEIDRFVPGDHSAWENWPNTVIDALSAGRAAGDRTWWLDLADLWVASGGKR